MAKPYSKAQNLTGTLTALAGGYTAGICLINNSGASMSYKLNGGDTIALANGNSIYHPEVENTSEVTVSGSTGACHYVIYQN